MTSPNRPISGTNTPARTASPAPTSPKETDTAESSKVGADAKNHVQSKAIDQDATTSPRDGNAVRRTPAENKEIRHSEHGYRLISIYHSVVGAPPSAKIEALEKGFENIGICFDKGEPEKRQEAKQLVTKMLEYTAEQMRRSGENLTHPKDWEQLNKARSYLVNLEHRRGIEVKHIEKAIGVATNAEIRHSQRITESKTNAASPELTSTSSLNELPSPEKPNAAAPELMSTFSLDKLPSPQKRKTRLEITEKVKTGEITELVDTPKGVFSQALALKTSPPLAMPVQTPVATPLATSLPEPPITS